MFSKSLALFLISLFSLSCARESGPSNPAIEVRLKGDGECLSSLGSSVERYLKGRMSRAEVVEFWDCTAHAVREYQRLTSGDGPKGSYTPQALRRFLYRYFIKSNPLDDALLAHLMELKRVLLSGSVSEITRDELTHLHSLLGELKTASLELHPHVLILFGDQPASDIEVAHAASAFESALKRMGLWLDNQGQSYSFSQFRGLLNDLKSWLKGDQFARLEKLAELLPIAKRILVSGRSDQIEGASWSSVTELGGRSFRIFLYFKQAFRNHLNEGLVRGLVPEALDAAASILETSALRRGGPGVPLKEWALFFQRLEATGLLPEAMTAQAMDQAFRWLVIRALGSGELSEELTTTHAARLRQQARIWLGLLNGESNFLEADLFTEMLNRSVPMAWDGEGRLIHTHSAASSWTEEARRRMVWPFALLNWIKTSYVAARPSLTEDEMSLAVAEILPVLQGFGWMSETKPTIGKRILREADLFTQASNGDFELDLAEATRYLAFVASGLRVAEIWLGEADQECGHREAGCVRELATRPGSRALDSLPHLKAFVLKAKPAEFINYMQRAEETVLGKVTVGPMSTKNILQAWQLFQYVETFLTIYDLDRGETIGLLEAGPAFDRYGPTLAKLLRASHMPSDEIWAFFTFMMKYGDTPFGLFGGQILFNHWKWHRNDWVFAADRQTLMGILNQLSKL